MDTTIQLIYCDGKSRWRNTIAAQQQYLAGTRHGDTVYRQPLYFIDQNWKKPNFISYAKFIEKYKPTMASVIDITDNATLLESLAWAEAIAPFVDYIILIPKISVYIPAQLYGKEVVLGYSVPTKYGGTYIDDKYFDKHKVHLLGGSPHVQLGYRGRFNIFSVDVNYHGMMATKFRHYWTNGSRKWIKGDTAEQCFTQSSINIRNEWYGISNTL